MFLKKVNFQTLFRGRPSEDVGARFQRAFLSDDPTIRRSFGHSGYEKGDGFAVLARTSLFRRLDFTVLTSPSCNDGINAKEDVPGGHILFLGVYEGGGG